VRLLVRGKKCVGRRDKGGGLENGRGGRVEKKKQKHFVGKSRKGGSFAKKAGSGASIRRGISLSLRNRGGCFGWIGFQKKKRGIGREEIPETDEEGKEFHEYADGIAGEAKREGLPVEKASEGLHKRKVMHSIPKKK